MFSTRHFRIPPTSPNQNVKPATPISTNIQPQPSEGTSGLPRSEVIVPIFASDATTVIGTIDVESDRENAFDRATEASLERVQLGGKAFLSSTLLDGRFWLRACIVNPRASRDDIDILIAAVRAAAEAETCVP